MCRIYINTVCVSPLCVNHLWCWLKMQNFPLPLRQPASVGDTDMHESCRNTITDLTLRCVPFPICWLLRGDGKHLFIILCIISQSIILITSFPQDSGEMGLSYRVGKDPVLGASYSYLSTLPVFPRLLSRHLSLCSACSSQTMTPKGEGL